MNINVLFLKCEWFILINDLTTSMFWEVSNYNLWPMEKTNFCTFLFLVFSSVLCNSEDYNYKYDDYPYDENYDYDNQKPEDYTDDYSQGFNDYYDQNQIAFPNPPPMGKITFFSFLSI